MADYIVHPESPGVQIRQVPEWPGYYVDELGGVWSSKRLGRFTKPGGNATRLNGPLKRLSTNRGNKGHLRFIVTSPGRKRRNLILHRTILLAFVGLPPPGCTMALHNNGHESDNRLCNLRWGTAKDNSTDMVLHGTSTRGEKNPCAKIAAQDAKAIKMMLARGCRFKDIADQFMISMSAVMDIKAGRTWKHVPIGAA